MSRILLVHLSDIHFHADKVNLVENRVQAIANSLVRFSGENLKHIFIITTGDIAQSGSEEEYEVAGRFFSSLQDCIKSCMQEIKLNFIFTPGNHDCDFSSVKSRSYALRSILSDGEFATTDVDTLAEIASVQKNYFDFVTKFSVVDFSKARTKLVCDYKFEIENITINFRSLNSAWCSEHKECPGALHFPTAIIDNMWPQASITVALLHHVPFWFNPNNHSKLRAILEKNCNLILTGHQHTAHSSKAESINNTFEMYQLEGGALQANGIPSRYSVIEIETISPSFLNHEFEFDIESNLYEYVRSSDSCPIITIQTLRNKEFALKVEQNDFVNDPGTPYSHPHKKKLKLDDIFVFPDLDPLSFSNGAEKATIHSENILTKIIYAKKVIISSKDGHGKTSLSKSLFMHLFKHDFYPILFNGSDIKSVDESKLTSLIENQVKANYVDKSMETWASRPVTNRCIIIDDFHKSKFNTEGHSAIISHLSIFADIIILFTSDLYNIEMISTPNSSKSILDNFSRFSIKSFGLRLRGQLIRKWVSLGTKYENDATEIEYVVNRLEHLVNSSLMNRLLPATPFFILSLIQTIESQKITQAPIASFGQIYEALVVASLSSVSEETPLDVKFNILAELAYYLFQSEVSSINESTLDSIINGYLLEYKITLKSSTARSILVNSGIIRNGIDRFSFKHSYSYCYFVAKAIANRRLRLTNTEGTNSSIESIVKNTHINDNGNILLFYIHLTKDEAAIIRLLEEAGKFYDSEPLFMIPDDFKFFQEGTPPEISFSIPEGSAKDNREKHYRNVDRYNVENETSPEQDGQDPEEQRRGESGIMSDFNKSFKLIQLLGHILCYFPGSLPAVTKEKLLKEAVDLTRRTMRFMSTLMTENREALSDFVKETLTQKYPEIEMTELQTRINHSMHIIAFYCNQLAIKKITTAIGNEHIFTIFDDALSIKKDRLLELVRLELTLQHKHEIPFREIQSLQREFNGDQCLVSLLKNAVAEFLYLYPCKQADKQRLTALAGIEIRPSQKQKERVPELSSAALRPV